MEASSRGACVSRSECRERRYVKDCVCGDECGTVAGIFDKLYSNIDSYLVIGKIVH